ncbi:hypothetical protein POV27_14865 [Aureisphaera galaxeae]|uniref:hypothetical protein n=1 Tax=Aureisphaera galaxeae TaxID=1538023 RepID=UPI00234FEF29|nr:hypothetical protein [Aureisphaera galaxeae]MDC8005342.1 hypothetical protein [Aureisphaera galaxeae]
MGQPVIKSNSVIKSGDKFIQVIKICNESNTDETLWVTSWPYEKEKGKAKKKINAKRSGKRIKIAKGKCKTVVFEHTKKPYQYYTDLYRYKAGGNHQGKWFGWNVNIVKIFDLDAFLEKIRKLGIWHFQYISFLPYPMRQEVGGSPRQFKINNVKGLPEGWEVSWLSPEIGQVLNFYPNQKNDQVLLEFVASNANIENERLDILIDAGLVDEPDTPFNSIPIGLTAVRRQSLPEATKIRYRYDKEYPHLRCRITVTDKQGLMDAPEITYSTDGGKSWIREDMKLDRVYEFTDLGMARARFSAWIPLPKMNADVLVGYVLNDQFCNTVSVPMEMVSGENRKK